MNKTLSYRTPTTEEMNQRKESFQALSQKLHTAGYITKEQEQPLADKLFTQFFPDKREVPETEQIQTVKLISTPDKATTMHSEISIISYPDKPVAEVQWLRCTLDNITKDITPVFDTHLPSIQAVAILLKDTQALHKRLASKHSKTKNHSADPFTPATSGHRNTKNTIRYLEQFDTNKRNTSPKKKR